MPIRKYMESASLEVTQVMTEAYADVCRRLEETGQSHISTGRVAGKIADFAGYGVIDAKTLAEEVFSVLTKSNR